MPEQNTTAPEIPVSTTPPNDLFAETANSAENNRFEKIISAGERVFQKFGIVKPGRGRPRKDGQPKKSDLVATDPGQPSQPFGNPVVAGSPAIPAQLDQLRVKAFAAGCCGLLRGAVAFAKKWVRKNAEAAKIDKSFADRTLAECAPSDADFKEWQDAMEVCATQYRWDFEHMPAVSLGVKTVGIFAPFVSLAGEFRKEIARQRAKDQATNGGVQ